MNPLDGQSYLDVVAAAASEEGALAYVERLRWPDGPRCPHCGATDVARGRQGTPDAPLRRRRGQNPRRATRRPIWHCRGCRQQFSVTTGTVMEGSHLPLRKWLLAYAQVAASKKGVSSSQLKRMLGTSSRTAWHLSHRIRKTMEAPADAPLAKLTGVVESDEAYLGGKKKHVGRGYRKNKAAVQTIVQRSEAGPDGKVKKLGQARTVALGPTESPDGRTLGANLRKHTVPAETHLMTDENPAYNAPGRAFKSHKRVHHKSEDYAHVDPETGMLVTTNSAEGFTANLKRRLTGTHHSVSKKHLPRYLKEADHLYNERGGPDAEIMRAATDNMEGPRLRLFRGRAGGGDALIDPDDRAHKGAKRGPKKKRSKK